MDQKQKLNETYLPDKANRKEKIVIALSGGVDSYVSAYLLKIQKYDLIGVTVSQNVDAFPKSSEKLSCLMTEERIGKIKAFCHQLGIPHFVVKIDQEFQDRIIDPWIGQHLTGQLPTACWSCHDLRMKQLYLKMRELGASHMATGHFAKIYMSDANSAAFVHTSNDELHDQAALLSRLPQEILKILLLPLSDLQKKEVLKLAENFGLEDLKAPVPMFGCLSWDPELKEYVAQRVPAKMLKVGELEFLNGDGLGDHEGVLSYTYGQNLKDSQPKIHKDAFVGKVSFSTKKVSLVEESFFQKESVMLVDCEFSAGISFEEPISGYVKFGGEFVDCWIFPKTLNAAYLEWQGPHRILEGDILVVYKKKGKNSKIFLSGKTRFMPARPKPEEGEKNVQVDYSRDY